MAGGSIEIRDILLKDGIIDRIMDLIDRINLTYANSEIGENICWLLSNLAREPTTDIQYLK